MKLEFSTEIELDDYDLDKAITEKAAELLLNQVNLKKMTHQAISDMIYKKLDEIIMQKIEELLDKPVVRVDRFGDVIPDKTPKTFKDVFADTAESFLREHCDSNGRPSTGIGSQQRLAYLIRQAGIGQLDQHCRTVAAQFKKEIDEKAKKAVAEAISKTIKL